jgi:hypothetical protein
MKNVKLTVTNDKLLIEVDLAEKGMLSKSGKSVVIASTEGNKTIPETENIKVGLNVYKPNK